MKDEVLFVMGGFHLGEKNKDVIAEIISDFKQLGVRCVGPCHCSGDTVRQVFEKEYQNMFIPIGVGTVVTKENLT